MSEVVSARLPAGYKERLESMLDGRSLAVWLREVVDGDAQVAGLETDARRLADTVKRQREELQVVSSALQEQRAPLSQLDELRRAGVKVEDLVAWSRVLNNARLKPSELAGELERCGSMCTAIKKLEDRRADLETAVAALARKQSEVERAITTTRNTTVKAISDLRAKSLEEISVLLDGLNKKIAAHGEACRLTEQLKRDLPLAAYLHAMADAQMAREVPPLAIAEVLARVREWALSASATLKGKPPEVVTGGNWLLRSWELSLEDLLLWAASMILPLCDLPQSVGRAGGL